MALQLPVVQHRPLTTLGNLKRHCVASAPSRHCHWPLPISCVAAATMACRRRCTVTKMQASKTTKATLLSRYSWEQGEATDQELRITFPVPFDTTAKDVDFKISEKNLRIALKGDPLLEGELWSTIDVEESYFELEDFELGRSDELGRFLVVYLAKCHVETWEEVLKPTWTWEAAGRHNEEIKIYVPIGDDVKASEIEFQLSYGHIEVRRRGEALLVGELWGQVDSTDYDWMIEQHDQRCVVITLGKLHVREHWDRLLKSEEGRGGWETFKPGSRKDIDMAVLGSLDYVNTLLHQKDVEYAREYLDHILPPETGEDEA